MASENETFADIVSEMREFADTDSQSIGRDVLRRRIQNFANRIGSVWNHHFREVTKMVHSEQVNNAAKMREALLMILGTVDHLQTRFDMPKLASEEILELKQIAESALSAPPRNCDVGTVAEQNERFDKYCYDHRSHEICYGKCPIFGEPCCELAWSQMPYEAGGEE